MLSQAWFGSDMHFSINLSTTKESCDWYTKHFTFNFLKKKKCLQKDSTLTLWYLQCVHWSYIQLPHRKCEPVNRGDILGCFNGKQTPIIYKKTNKQIMKQNRPVSYFYSNPDGILIMFLKFNLPHNLWKTKILPAVVGGHRWWTVYCLLFPQ